MENIVVTGSEPSELVCVDNDVDMAEFVVVEGRQALSSDGEVYLIVNGGSHSVLQNVILTNPGVLEKNGTQYVVLNQEEDNRFLSAGPAIKDEPEKDNDVGLDIPAQSGLYSTSFLKFIQQQKTRSDSVSTIEVIQDKVSPVECVEGLPEQPIKVKEEPSLAVEPDVTDPDVTDPDGGVAAQDGDLEIKSKDVELSAESLNEDESPSGILTCATAKISGVEDDPKASHDDKIAKKRAVNDEKEVTASEVRDDDGRNELIKQCFVVLKPLSANPNLRLNSLPVKRKRGRKSNKELSIIIKRRKCTVCEFTCKHKHQMTVHMRTHTGERPYKCEVCNASFAQKTTFQRHSLIHTDEKPHLCDFCGRAFRTKSQLVIHNRRHTGEKPYLCNKCGFSCTTSTGMKYHMTRHDGDGSELLKKPRERHECPVCHKILARVHTLKLHLRGHDGVKPHKCEICERSFSQRGSLTTHMAVHIASIRKFKCSFCSKSFIRNAFLQRHEMIHKSDKPHKCDECGKAFVQKSNMKAHMRLHFVKKNV